jgi:AGCS family alanine or glycine:cation symporter
MLPLALRLSVTREDGAPGDVSQFAALATALAATDGTGNIIGVAAAVKIGGPGAVLWCWLTGIFGMATKYGEGLLAVRFRVKSSGGTMTGGPMYAIERGLGLRPLAQVFALAAMLCSFGIGSSVQSNALTTALYGAFGVNRTLASVVAAAASAAVILGGVKSVARLCGIIVPAFAGGYLIVCAAVIAVNRAFLPAAAAAIVRGAFGFNAVAGGAAGGGLIAAVRAGVSRGLFSNESGLGSAPIAAAAAQTDEPARQALISMTGTFWDTVVICAMTGVAVVTAALRYPEAASGAGAARLSQLAFANALPYGRAVHAVMLAAFAFSTVIGWSYYGERCCEYLFGGRAVTAYRCVYVAAAFFGGVMPLELVWAASDSLNALMAVPNLISLIALSGVIAAETRRFRGSRSRLRAARKTPPGV